MVKLFQVSIRLSALPDVIDMLLLYRLGFFKLWVGKKLKMFSFANIAPPGLYILHNVLKAQGVDSLVQMQLDDVLTF